MSKYMETVMEAALEIAQKGRGFVNPNPMVGAVIEKDGKIIAKGYHQRYGQCHAEVDALNNARLNGITGQQLTGCTLYVTLEPCSHYGKTPPCAKAIVDSGIKKAVVAVEDPNPLVSGKGIGFLRENGVEVTVGVLKQQAEKLNEIFFKYITTGQPFCAVKTAMTLDGKTAAFTGQSRWITCPESRERVHLLRHYLSAVMVGVNTVIQDDPLLNVRLNMGEISNPVRVVVDSNGRTPPAAKVLGAGTILACTSGISAQKKAVIEQTDTEIIQLPDKNGRVCLNSLMTELGKRKIDSVLIEGGGTLNYSALEQGIVDKVIAFIAPKIIGGSGGYTPFSGLGRSCMGEAWNLKDVTIEKIGQDIVIEGSVQK